MTDHDQYGLFMPQYVWQSVADCLCPSLAKYAEVGDSMAEYVRVESSITKYDRLRPFIAKYSRV